MKRSKLLLAAAIAAALVSGCKTVPEEERFHVRPETVYVDRPIPVPCNQTVKVGTRPAYPGRGVPENQVIWLEQMIIVLETALGSVSSAAVLCGVTIDAD